MARTIIVDELKKDSDATPMSIDGVAKAWANYDLSSTLNIRDSLNISSSSDDGTGVVTLNYTNDFTNANYVVCGHTGRSLTSSETAYWTFPCHPSDTYTMSSIGLSSGFNGGSSSALTKYDAYLSLVSMQGDLA